MASAKKIKALQAETAATRKRILAKKANLAGAMAKAVNEQTRTPRP